MRKKVVVVGAGLGGLTAAAKLSSNFDVTVLEKSSFVGGRCSSRSYDNQTFDVAAILFGSRLKKIVEALGGTINSKQIKYQIIYKNQPITFPTGLHTFRELKKHGVNHTRIVNFLTKSLLHHKLGFFSQHATIKNIVHELTDHAHLRNILKSVTLFSGLEPQNAHRNYFKYFFWGHKYGYDKPFYPNGGAVTIPEELKRIITQNNSEVLPNSEVKKIVTRNKRVVSVQTEYKKYRADVVISDLDINSTLNLVGVKFFKKEFVEHMKQAKPKISMATMLFKLKATRQIFPKDVLFIAQVPEKVEDEIELVKNGIISSDCLYLLEIPTNLNENKKDGDTHSGTLLTLIKRNASRKEVKSKLDYVISQVETQIPLFMEKITWKRVLAPIDYKKEIGIDTIIGLDETIHLRKPLIKTPIKGLYLAGDSTQPEVACAVQAAESGLLVAKEVLKNQPSD